MRSLAVVIKRGGSDLFLGSGTSVRQTPMVTAYFPVDSASPYVSATNDRERVAVFSASI